MNSILDFTDIVTRSVTIDSTHNPISVRSYLTPEKYHEDLNCKSGVVWYNITDICMFCGYRNVDPVIKKYVPEEAIRSFTYYDMSSESLRTFKHTTDKYAINIALMSRAYHPIDGAYIDMTSKEKYVYTAHLADEEVACYKFTNVPAIYYADDVLYRDDYILPKLGLTDADVAGMIPYFKYYSGIKYAALQLPTFTTANELGTSFCKYVFINASMIRFLITHAKNEKCIEICANAGLITEDFEKPEEKPSDTDSLESVKDLCENILDRLIHIEEEIAKIKQELATL